MSAQGPDFRTDLGGDDSLVGQLGHLHDVGGQLGNLCHGRGHGGVIEGLSLQGKEGYNKVLKLNTRLGPLRLYFGRIGFITGGLKVAGISLGCVEGLIHHIAGEYTFNTTLTQ